MKNICNNQSFPFLAEEAAAMETEAFVVEGMFVIFFLKRESKDIDVVVLGSGIDLAKESPNGWAIMCM